MVSSNHFKLVYNLTTNCKIHTFGYITNVKICFLKYLKCCSDSESGNRFCWKNWEITQNPEKLQNTFCLNFGHVGTYSNCAKLNPVNVEDITFLIS